MRWALFFRPQIFNSDAMQQLRPKHVCKAARVKLTCCTSIPHPVLVAGSLLLHGESVRKILPIVERLIYLSKLPKRWLKPQRPQPAAKREDLVQIK